MKRLLLLLGLVAIATAQPYSYKKGDFFQWLRLKRFLVADSIYADHIVGVSPFPASESARVSWYAHVLRRAADSTRLLQGLDSLAWARFGRLADSAAGKLAASMMHLRDSLIGSSLGGQWLSMDSAQFALGRGHSWSSGSAKNYLNIGRNNRLRAYTDWSKAIVGGEACTSENASWATGIVGCRKAHVADKVSFAGGSSSVTLMGENSASVGSESCYAFNSTGATTFISSGGNGMGRIIDSATGNAHIGYQRKGKELVLSSNCPDNFLWNANIDIPVDGSNRAFSNNAVLGHGNFGIFDTVRNVVRSFIGPGYRGTLEGRPGRYIYYMFSGTGKYNTVRSDSTDTLWCPAIVTGQNNTVRASYSGVLTGLNDYIDTLANASYLFGTDCTTQTPATAAFYSATGLAARPTSPYNMSVGYRRPPLADTGLKVAGRGVFGLPVTAQKVIGVNGGYKSDTTVADSQWVTRGYADAYAARCTTTSDTLTVRAWHRYVYVTTGEVANLAITLPAATGSMRVIGVEKVDAGGGTVRITPNSGSDHINGADYFDRTSQWSGATLQDVATGVWYTIPGGQ